MGREKLKNEFIELISSSAAQVFIALNNKGEAIGMAVGKIQKHPHHIPEIYGTIEQVFVKKECRGQRVGTKLIILLCKFFASKKVEDISIKNVVGNKEAEKFWSRLGFTNRIVTAGVKLEHLLENISATRLKE